MYSPADVEGAEVMVGGDEEGPCDRYIAEPRMNQASFRPDLGISLTKTCEDGMIQMCTTQCIVCRIVLPC